MEAVCTRILVVLLIDCRRCLDGRLLNIMVDD